MCAGDGHVGLIFTFFYSRGVFNSVKNFPCLHIAELHIAELHIAELHIAELHIAELHIAELHIAEFLFPLF
jgi:hypothetical protein